MIGDIMVEITKLILIMPGAKKCPWCGLNTLKNTETRKFPKYYIYDCNICGARYRTKIKGD